MRKNKPNESLCQVKRQQCQLKARLGTEIKQQVEKKKEQGQSLQLKPEKLLLAVLSLACCADLEKPQGNFSPVVKAILFPSCLM